VSLPRFLTRVVDATAPALGGLDRATVEAKLETTAVTLVGSERTAAGPGRAGFLMAANLLARLYPRIMLIGPEELVAAAEREIVLVSPFTTVATSPMSKTATESTCATLVYDSDDVSTATGDDDGATVVVAAHGWNVYVDDVPESDVPPAPAAALAAAVVGVAELFRSVFADELGARGRRRGQPGAFNQITLGEPRDVDVPDEVNLGEFRLVGAGAIGQAAAHTLAVSGTRGTLVAVDHETVTLSNLQRYVLTRDSDVGAVKVDLMKERLARSALDVVSLRTEWYAGLVEAQLPTLVALDSPEARIGVQASLPGPIYNAWTQPEDVGWSRHERFGEEACLACLYWPDHEVPSQHEQVALAFRQHPLRTLAYLVRPLPIGLPLPPGATPTLPDLPAPPDAERWQQTPLVDDIAAAAGIDVSELAGWRDRPLADVYQDGICGGALLHLNVGQTPREVLVPLAHQSVFAGIMLAVEAVASAVPELRALRPQAIEGRYDVLVGLPQLMPRPRARTSSCLCGDIVWRDVYHAKLGVQVGEVT
jgi:hypothetical protein